MPRISLDAARRIIPEVTDEDGPILFLCRRHWVAWVPFWLRAIPAAALCLVAAWLLLRGSVRAPLTQGAVAVAVVVAGKFLVLDYLRLTREVLLFSPERVYEQTRRYLWRYSVRVYNLAEHAEHEVRPEWLNGLGIDARRVTVTMKGTAKDLVYEHAAGGEATERGVNQIIALRRS